MELSSKVRYALLALLELSKYYELEEFLQIEQIAASQQIPNRYLGQLLMVLRRSGIVRSQRGAKGGYMLGKPPQEITVLEILTCLEGTAIQEHQKQNDSSTMESMMANMVIQEVWQEATDASIAIFRRYTLKDLQEKQQDRQGSNHMYYI